MLMARSDIDNLPGMEPDIQDIAIHAHGKTGKVSYRTDKLDPIRKMYLVWEIVATNKPYAFIAHKFGVSRQDVSRLAASIALRAKHPIEYDNNGRLVFSRPIRNGPTLQSKKESFCTRQEAVWVGRHARFL